MSASLVLPANLPSVSRAKLPQNYEGAKTALAQCERIDECKDWADKMEAMASYAKQAKDDMLRVTCDRIQARAIRRCGELLRQVRPDPKPGRPATKNGGGASPITRSQAAREAGLTRDEKRQALRVSNVPEDEFEEAVEAPRPATVTELAERGKRPSPARERDDGRSPKDFASATEAIGVLREFAEFCGRSRIDAIGRGANGNEKRTMRAQCARIQDWLKQLAREIES